MPVPSSSCGIVEPGLKSARVLESSRGAKIGTTKARYIRGHKQSGFEGRRNLHESIALPNCQFSEVQLGMTIAKLTKMGEICSTVSLH